MPELKDITASSPENILLEAFKIKWLEQKELEIAAQKHNSKIKQRGESFAAESSAGKRNKSFNLVLLTKEPLLIANKSEAGNRVSIPMTTYRDLPSLGLWRGKLPIDMI